MGHPIRLCASAVLLVASALPLEAQTPPAGDAGGPPPVLFIYREEVKPGRGAAHEANEAAWAAAYRKGQSPERWLGMTSVIGPSEAWFMSGQPSYAAFEKAQQELEANASLEAEGAKYSAAEGDMLTRTSSIVARYRPALSYQPGVSLPTMRYMTVDIMRVKPGHEGDFASAWRDIVEAHKKAGMQEHWAVFEVEAGMPDTTYLFMYARKSLAEIDEAGPIHGAAAYRDAVGEAGRLRQRDLIRESVVMSQTLVFRLRPTMSVLTDEWTKVDPEFWLPKPAPAMAQKKK